MGLGVRGRGAGLDSGRTLTSKGYTRLRAERMYGFQIVSSETLRQFVLRGTSLRRESQGEFFIFFLLKKNKLFKNLLRWA